MEERWWDKVFSSFCSHDLLGGAGKRAQQIWKELLLAVKLHQHPGMGEQSFDDILETPRGQKISQGCY